MKFTKLTRKTFDGNSPSSAVAMCSTEITVTTLCDHGVATQRSLNKFRLIESGSIITLN